MIEPLPCPFCGGPPEISESDDGQARWVWCPACEADGPPIDYRFKGTHEEAREIVVAAWNSRKASNQQLLDACVATIAYLHLRADEESNKLWGQVSTAVRDALGLKLDPTDQQPNGENG